MTRPNNIALTRHTDPYNALVLSGGGIYGFALLGCLQKLYEKQYLSSITLHVGTSVGAVIHYLLCIGYAPYEIFICIWEAELMTHLKTKAQYFNIFNKQSGILDWGICHAFLVSMAKRKRISPHLTLKQLHEMFGKELVCCTYNYSKQSVEYISYQTFPDLPCLTALRMTSNIPVIFSVFEYDNSFYMDGAFYCNFPLYYVDLDRYRPIGISWRYQTKKLHDLSFFNYLYELLCIPSFHLHRNLNITHESSTRSMVIEIDLSSISRSFHLFVPIKVAIDLFFVGYNSC